MCRDPDEDYLVALATASRSEVIATGDLDLLAIDPNHFAAEIITPRHLIDPLG